MKTCRRCRTEKLLIDFYVNRACADGRTIYCKACCNVASKLSRKKHPGPSKRIASRYAKTDQGRAARKASRVRVKERMRSERPEEWRALQRAKKNRRLANMKLDPARWIPWSRSRTLKRFGMSLGDFDAMAAKQGGVCAICKRPQANGKPLAVDHCHISGAVRALLCNRCNTAMGVVDDPPLLDALIRYRESHHQTPITFKAKRRAEN